MSFRIIGTLLAAVLAIPGVAAAQSATTGAIAGIVRDTTGAVMPGVTVEAASPALIEKVRTAVTDDQGNYKVVDLRPGTYTVTFTLPGFATFKREGLELSTGFTATVNGEMKVGSLEETVTVTGASPIVDIQNARTQAVLSRDALDTLPTGKAINGYTTLILGASTGATQDVGGNKGEVAIGMAIHGGHLNDSKLKLDGNSYNSLHFEGGGQMRTFHVNQLAVQEASFETSGISAESDTGGVQMNFVPKDGGNRFTLQSVIAFATHGMQGNNLNDELRARGLTSSSSVKRVYEAGVGIGGPIVKDKLWFYNADRFWGAQEYQPGSYYNLNQGKYVGAANSGVSLYAPDLSRPGFVNRPDKDFTFRVTWQATTKHKIAVTHDLQDACDCLGTSSVSAPEAAANLEYGPDHLTYGSWNYTATNKLLIQAGANYGYYGLSPAYTEGTTANDISIKDQSTGLLYNSYSGLVACCAYGSGNRSNPANERFSVSYVTGSHAVKTGVFLMQGWHDQNQFINRSIAYTLAGTVPISLTQYATPYIAHMRLRTFSWFGQDQWTLSRLTLNVGVRYDQFRGYNLPADAPAGPFVDARQFPGNDDVPNWKDFQPRLGAAYDLFGDGKTAVKFSLGRYVASMASGLTELNNAAQQAVISATRTWADGNANYVPDCNLRNLGANGECGTVDNSLFGSVSPSTTFDDDVLRGFGVRPYEWDVAAQLQHELHPGTALNVGYFRRWYGNFWAMNNTALTAASFDPYCVTAPTDTRLGSFSGQQICGLYDVKPAQFGLRNNVVMQASNFGEQHEVYNGIDVGLTSRFGTGGMLNAGVSVGRTTLDNCYANAMPQVLTGNPAGGFLGQYFNWLLGPSTPRTNDFCDITPSWSSGTQFKVNGVYPLPWDLQVSGTLQNLPGVADSAILIAPNPVVAPSLGRDLAAGPFGFALINILPSAGAVYEDRLTQVDVRLTKILKAGSVRIKGMLDVFNLFNASTVLGVNGVYGPAYQLPTSILGARLFKVGTQIDW